MMGPFVPEFISEPLNLVVAFFLGIAFGWVLEQAGFSSSRRLAGVFYGYDFTVLRVFFTAALTAMSGVMLLGYFGLLEVEAIFVNPLWLKPALLGGVIMGLGFILGGYCPGTSVCAAAIGKVDALFFVGGGLLGVFLFAEAYPLYKGFYDSTALGPVTVFRSLGISQGLFAFLLIAVAVGAFFVTTRIERKVAGSEAPSREFTAWKHLAAGAGVLLLGLVLIFLPNHRTRILNRVSAPSFRSAHPIPEMDADELAFRVLDQEARLRILDLRPATAFKALALPGAVNLRQADLFGREFGTSIAPRRDKKLILAATEEEARTACLILQELGFENLAILKGGFGEFERLYLQAGALTPGEGRWAEEVRAFRERARQELPKLIAASRAAGSREPRPEKKIQGGC